MFDLVDGKLYWDGLSLSEMKNIERNEDSYVITKPDDSTVLVSTSLLIPNDVRMFDAFVEEYTNRVMEYQSELDKAKEDKIIELDTACTSDILNGFLSSAKNSTEKMYDFDTQDQANMTAYRSMIDDGEDIYWKAKGELIAYVWTAEEFVQLCKDARLSKLTKIRFYHELRYYVTVATTIEEVNAIFW